MNQSSAYMLKSARRMTGIEIKKKIELQVSFTENEEERPRGY